jgi:hypothetical protein
MFVYDNFEKGVNIYIMAVKVQIHNSIPKRIGLFVGWESIEELFS